MIKKEPFFLNMTAQQYREMMGLAKPTTPNYYQQSKYHNQKVEINGRSFDSKKESKDWMKLKSMEDSGLIKDLRCQVPFELQPKYTTKDGRKIRAITYVADFVYERDGVMYAQDSKGMKTDVYKIKRKMFEYKYPDIIFVES